MPKARYENIVVQELPDETLISCAVLQEEINISSNKNVFTIYLFKLK